MTVTDAWNRGNNLLATAIVSLSAFAFLPEFFFEDEWQHKIDEGLLFLLGLGAIWWYKRGDNRFSHSVLPIVFVLAGLGIKLLGLIIEIKDKEDVGDEFGAVILFILASLLVVWIYKQKQTIN